MVSLKVRKKAYRKSMDSELAPPLNSVGEADRPATPPRGSLFDLATIPPQFGVNNNALTPKQINGDKSKYKTIHINNSKNPAELLIPMSEIHDATNPTESLSTKLATFSTINSSISNSLKIDPTQPPLSPSKIRPRSTGSSSSSGKFSFRDKMLLTKSLSTYQLGTNTGDKEEGALKWSDPWSPDSANTFPVLSSTASGSLEEDKEYSFTKEELPNDLFDTNVTFPAFDVIPSNTSEQSESKVHIEQQNDARDKRFQSEIHDDKTKETSSQNHEKEDMALNQSEKDRKLDILDNMSLLEKELHERNIEREIPKSPNVPNMITPVTMQPQPSSPLCKSVSSVQKDVNTTQQGSVHQIDDLDYDDDSDAQNTYDLESILPDGDLVCLSIVSADNAGKDNAMMLQFKPTLPYLVNDENKTDSDDKHEENNHQNDSEPKQNGTDGLSSLSHILQNASELTDLSTSSSLVWEPFLEMPTIDEFENFKDSDRKEAYLKLSHVITNHRQELEKNRDALVSMSNVVDDLVPKVEELESERKRCELEAQRLNIQLKRFTKDDERSKQLIEMQEKVEFAQIQITEKDKLVSNLMREINVQEEAVREMADKFVAMEEAHGKLVRENKILRKEKDSNMVKLPQQHLRETPKKVDVVSLATSAALSTAGAKTSNSIDLKESDNKEDNSKDGSHKTKKLDTSAKSQKISGDIENELSKNTQNSSTEIIQGREILDTSTSEIARKPENAIPTGFVKTTDLPRTGDAILPTVKSREKDQDSTDEVGKKITQAATHESQISTTLDILSSDDNDAASVNNREGSEASEFSLNAPSDVPSDVPSMGITTTVETLPTKAEIEITSSLKKENDELNDKSDDAEQICVKLKIIPQEEADLKDSTLKDDQKLPKSSRGPDDITEKSSKSELKFPEPDKDQNELPKGKVKATTPPSTPLLARPLDSRPKFSESFMWIGTGRASLAVEAARKRRRKLDTSRGGYAFGFEGINSSPISQSRMTEVPPNKWRSMLWRKTHPSTCGDDAKTDIGVVPNHPNPNVSFLSSTSERDVHINRLEKSIADSKQLFGKVTSELALAKAALANAESINNNKLKVLVEENAALREDISALKNEMDDMLKVSESSISNGVVDHSDVNIEESFVSVLDEESSLNRESDLIGNNEDSVTISKEEDCLTSSDDSLKSKLEELQKHKNLAEDRITILQSELEELRECKELVGKKENELSRLKKANEVRIKMTDTLSKEIETIGGILEETIRASKVATTGNSIGVSCKKELDDASQSDIRGGVLNLIRRVRSKHDTGGRIQNNNNIDTHNKKNDDTDNSTADENILNDEFIQLEKICKVHQHTILVQRNELHQLQHRLVDIDESHKAHIQQLKEEARLNEEKISILENQFVEINQAKNHNFDTTNMEDDNKSTCGSIIRVDAGYVSSLESESKENVKKISDLKKDLEKVQNELNEIIGKKAKVDMEMNSSLEKIEELEIKLKSREITVLSLEKALEECSTTNLQNTSDENKEESKREQVDSTNEEHIEDSPYDPSIMDENNVNAKIKSITHQAPLTTEEYKNELVGLKEKLASRDKKLSKLKDKVSKLEKSKSLGNEVCGDKKLAMSNLRRVGLIQEMLDSSARRLNIIVNTFTDTQEKIKGINSADVDMIFSLSDKMTLLQINLTTSLHVLESKFTNDLEAFRGNESEGSRVESNKEFTSSAMTDSLNHLIAAKDEVEKKLEQLKIEQEQKLNQLKNFTARISKSKDEALQELVTSNSELKNAMSSLKVEKENMMTLILQLKEGSQT